MIKCFKYFDLNNSQTVEPQEFAKAIEKIGIIIPTKQVSDYTSILLSSSHLATAHIQLTESRLSEVEDFEFGGQINYNYRILMPFSPATIRMVQAPSSTENSPLKFSARMLLEDPQLPR